MFKALGSIAPLGGLAANAGTPITALLTPRARAYTRLTRVLYWCGPTPHTVSVMKVLGTTTLTAAAAADATGVTVAADPGTGTVAGGVAVGDYVCVELGDGTFFLSKVGAVSGLTLTLDALPAAALSGAKLWFFGAPGDQYSSQTNPDPAVGVQFLAAAGELNDWSDAAGGVCVSGQVYEPLLVHSDNATSPGEMELVTGCHTIN